jgi:hypothetical protein
VLIIGKIFSKKMRRERNIRLISKNFFCSHHDNGQPLGICQSDMHIVVLAPPINFPMEITFHREKP